MNNFWNKFYSKLLSKSEDKLCNRAKFVERSINRFFSNKYYKFKIGDNNHWEYIYLKRIIFFPIINSNNSRIVVEYINPHSDNIIRHDIYLSLLKRLEIKEISINIWAELRSYYIYE